jgi:hypothetical protein
MAHSVPTNQNDKSHVEAWKSVIEFTKVIISFATTILAALLSYFVLNEIQWSWKNAISPFLLVLSMVLCLVGFGRAIRAIKNGNSEKVSLLASNLGTYVLIFAVLCLAFVSPNEKATIGEILSTIHTNTENFRVTLDPKACNSVRLDKDIYTLRYLISDSTAIVVKYDVSLDNIISIDDARLSTE